MVSDGPIRAVLFVPGDRPERFEKAAQAGADAVIVDLEDAVAPDRKNMARTAMAEAVRQGSLRPYVRVNGFGTPEHEADAEVVAELAQSGRLLGVLVPKAESATELSTFADRVPQRVDVVALIETARGCLAASEIAEVQRVTRLAFGALDLAADIGADESTLDMARFQVVLASRAARIAAPWDSPFTSFTDADAVSESAAHARRLGFGGKLCIHPAQVKPVRRAFMPTDSDIAWARRVIKADVGAATQVDGAMVDKPIVERARRILAEHDTHQEVL